MAIEKDLRATQRERAYEYGLPKYLQHDLDAYKDGLAHGSDLMDCLWGELYGSINIAEINDGVITPEPCGLPAAKISVEDTVMINHMNCIQQLC